MTNLRAFFIFYLFIFYGELIILMALTRKVGKERGPEPISINDARTSALYFFFISCLEFYTVAKYCYMLEIEALIQLLPLKISHYLFLATGIAHFNIKILCCFYIGLDVVFVVVFLWVRDASFSSIYHKYNMKIGTDIGVRNAFMIRNLCLMSKFNTILMNFVITLKSITFSLYDDYFAYNIIKTSILLCEICFAYKIKRENYLLKYISILVYTVFSVSGMIAMVKIIDRKL
ncbi:hypothetical protein NGRA_2039 [Nosema granulosis]|uniref:Uncharacterized protein n=1 Tax=Nosema granulosis TaxID=83296 RepID=A0A9P6GXA9_9MICR|nr:hypothetical protein NGRA_2039 [Nosema granulosis]